MPSRYYGHESRRYAREIAIKFHEAELEKLGLNSVNPVKDTAVMDGLIQAFMRKLDQVYQYKTANERDNMVQELKAIYGADSSVTEKPPVINNLPQPNGLRVRQLNTDNIFTVWKYLIDGEGDINIWSHDWYGHHKIGVDCEFVSAQYDNGFPVSKVCFFELRDQKYITKTGEEITTDMLMKYPHYISEDTSYIILD